MMSGSNQCQHKGKNSEYSHFFLRVPWWYNILSSALRRWFGNPKRKVLQRLLLKEYLQCARELCNQRWSMEAIHCNLIGILGKMFYEELQDGPWFVEDGRIFFFYEKMTDCVITLHPQWRKHQFVSKAHMKKISFSKRRAFLCIAEKFITIITAILTKRKKEPLALNPQSSFFFLHF